MDARAEDYGDDFATLVVELGRNDDASLVYDGTGATLRLPVYRWQAKELREVLDDLIANTNGGTDDE